MRSHHLIAILLLVLLVLLLLGAVFWRNYSQFSAVRGPEGEHPVHDREEHVNEEDGLAVPETRGRRGSSTSACCAATSFVVLLTSEEIDELRERETMHESVLSEAQDSGGFAAPSNREPVSAIFVQRVSGATDRLCLAFSLVDWYRFSVYEIELSQFDEVVFRGKLDVHLGGPSLRLVAIELDRKVFTDIRSLAAAIRAGDAEAVNFQRSHDIPCLDELETLLRDEDELGGLGPAERALRDRLSRRLLYISSIKEMVK